MAYSSREKNKPRQYILGHSDIYPIEYQEWPLPPKPPKRWKKPSFTELQQASGLPEEFSVYELICPVHSIPLLEIPDILNNTSNEVSQLALSLPLNSYSYIELDACILYRMIRIPTIGSHRDPYEQIDTQVYVPFQLTRLETSPELWDCILEYIAQSYNHDFRDFLSPDSLR